MTGLVTVPATTGGLENFNHPVVKLLMDPNAYAAIRALTPKDIEVEQIIMEAYHAAQVNPEILHCTPASIIRAVGLAAQTGLIIGDTVFLVPFNVNVAKKDEPKRFEKRLGKINGYKGNVDLVVRAGGARSLIAKVVYENEIAQGRFDYIEGTTTQIIHRQILDPAQRGEIAGGYAVAQVTQTVQLVQWMHRSEIEAIRAKSQLLSGGVLKPFYVKKTCINQLVNFLPRNPRMAVMREIFANDGPASVLSPGEIAEVVSVEARGEFGEDDDDTPSGSA